MNAPASLAVAGLLALSACSSDRLPTAHSSGPTALLTGTWRIVSIQPAAQGSQPAPSSAIYEVAFDGGRVSARLDCNDCNGNLSTAGSSVTIGPALACTRAACATMLFENIVVSVLPGEHELTAAGSAVTLRSARGVITLTKP